MNEYELRNLKGRSFTELLKVVILELPKLPEAEDSAVWHWLRFFKCKKKEEYEMLARQYPDLEEPVFCARKMSLLQRWRDTRFHENLRKTDERMLILQAQMEIARNALAEGATPEFVQKITGLSLDEIEGL